MIQFKTPGEVEIMRESCLLVGETIARIASLIRPGITTESLDSAAEEFILDHGATPSFKNYRGFPFTCCISVNDAVVHGFPNKYELAEGDIISLDVGVFKNRFHGDSAYTFALIGVNALSLQLMKVTKESLYKGIEKALPGNRVGDISSAVQHHTEGMHGYGIVRELVGHGLGKELHEDPQIPNYGKRGSGVKLKAGLVIAIEPMINLGKRDIYTDKDGWTIRTKDGKPSAHYEHTISVQKGKPDILSSFTAIEREELANANLDSTYLSMVDITTSL